MLNARFGRRLKVQETDRVIADAIRNGGPKMDSVYKLVSKTISIRRCFTKSHKAPFIAYVHDDVKSRHSIIASYQE